MKLIKFIHKILCLFDLHQYRVGMGWSANWMRFDGCKHCKHTRWIQDEIGHNNMMFQCKMFNERRRVLFEKRKKRLIA